MLLIRYGIAVYNYSLLLSLHLHICYILKFFVFKFSANVKSR